MEQIGNLLPDLSQRNNGKIDDSERSWRAVETRQTAIEALIIRLYTSARKELPEDDALVTEIRLAMDELKEIPDCDLGEAFREAQIEAGGFVPTNGLIVKCWRESKAGGFEDAQRALRLRNTEKYLLAKPPDDLPTQEQREENARLAADIAEQLRSQL